MSEELKPCPFCGGALWIGKVQIPVADGGWETSGFRPWCKECKMNLEAQPTKADAIAAWNTRSQSTTTPAGVSEAEVEIEGLIDAYWGLAYTEGAEGRKTDTPDGAAQRVRSAISRRISALSAAAAVRQQAEPVAVLEWKYHDDLAEIADSSLGPYLVDRHHGGRFLLWLPDKSGSARKFVEGFDTAEAAKAAAQADYEHRIRSALYPAPQPVAEPGEDNCPAFDPMFAAIECAMNAAQSSADPLSDMVHKTTLAMEAYKAAATHHGEER